MAAREDLPPLQLVAKELDFVPEDGTDSGNPFRRGKERLLLDQETIGQRQKPIRKLRGPFTVRHDDGPFAYLLLNAPLPHQGHGRGPLGIYILDLHVRTDSLT